MFPCAIQGQLTFTTSNAPSSGLSVPLHVPDIHVSSPSQSRVFSYNIGSTHDDSTEHIEFVVTSNAQVHDNLVTALIPLTKIPVDEIPDVGPSSPTA
ncbi:hypothetical protein V6N11_075340 [Hibiscus sabdariffa]|uniref:Uncharacterized protein n=1 Tax=Hibiscus sabdariffa TaxID=183260 RepID=A0ABR2R674_9ROSI